MLTYPDDLAIGSIDLVDCACVAGGDEIVPISILINAVDVEVVPSIGAIVARSSLTWVDGKHRFVGLNVIETGPFEEKFACGDIEL